jgi:hypothetical protein
MVYLIVLYFWAALFTGAALYTGWRIGCWLAHLVRG